jgi:hypothetical protein
MVTETATKRTTEGSLMDKDFILIINIAASVACLLVVILSMLIYKLTKANWTWVMAISYIYLFVVRVGITFELPVLSDYSRQLTGLNLVLQAIAFGMLYYDLQKMYRLAHNKHIKDIRESEKDKS